MLWIAKSKKTMQSKWPIIYYKIRKLHFEMKVLMEWNESNQIKKGERENEHLIHF